MQKLVKRAGVMQGKVAPWMTGVFVAVVVAAASAWRMYRMGYRTISLIICVSLATVAVGLMVAPEKFSSRRDRSRGSGRCLTCAVI